jgi:hypothetical protein
MLLSRRRTPPAIRSALEKFFVRRQKNENPNLYLLDRVSNIIYNNGIGERLSAACIIGKTI